MQAMSPIGLNLTALEQAVLRAICERHPAGRVPLEEQISAATVLSRENTGAGFHAYFGVERMSRAPVAGERLRDGPEARIDELNHGMGFIRWFEEGYLDCLEGYSYQDSTSAISFEQTSFEMLHD
jgi:hypothetical protein